MQPELKSFNKAIYEKNDLNEIKLKKINAYVPDVVERDLLVCQQKKMFFNGSFNINNIPIKSISKKKKGFRGNLGNDRTYVTKAL